MSETKKNVDSLNLEKVTAILLDVAGTTTAINFVEETLSPYITKNVEEFLKNHWDEEDVKKAVSQLEEKDLDATKAAEIVKALTEKSDKNVGLKNIQGLMYKKGYENGELKGHIFSDVPKCLELWSKSRKVAIFSTGSIESQQLLFKNSIEGDVSSHITKHFDQAIGPKTEADSYKKIAEELGVAPENILFLTDDVKEAEAAQSAAFNIVLVEREGNEKITEEHLSTFPSIKSFAEIPLENVKRKIEEETLEEPPTKVAKTEEKSATNGDSEIVEAEPSKIEEPEKVEKLAKEEEPVKEAERAEKKTEEKAEEAMEVDTENPEPSEKTKEEPEKMETSADKESVPEKKGEITEKQKENDTSESNQKIEKKATDEEKKEEMEVDTETKAAPSIENGESPLESKPETDIGTQTKTITNETETQTTISIRAAEEIPIEKVHDKLLDSTADEKVETVGTPEVKSDKVEKEPEKESSVVNETKVENNVEKCDTEEKTIDKPDLTKVEVELQKPEEIKSTEENNVEKQEQSKVEVELEKPEDVKTNDEKVVKQDQTKVEEKSVTPEDTKKMEEESEVALPKENGEKMEEAKEEKTKDVASEGKKSEEIKKTEGETENKETPVPTKENGVSEEKTDQIVEEKENKSELANSKENGVAKVETNDTAVDQKEDEIKVKKIEEKIESAPVSVEA